MKTPTSTLSLKRMIAHAAWLLLVASGPLLAHDDATLATIKTPHGGQLKESGDWRFELVQQAGAAGGNNTLLVYVTDHDGKPVATAGLKASATVLAGKEKQTATLLPDGDNRLKGTARYDVRAQPKIVVAVSGGGRSEQVRFTPAP